MVKRESFKIDPNDPDLKMFEEAIANFHPEFYALKQDGKPSYEHPDFCEITLEFSYLPGNKDPYDIHALNLFTIRDMEDYLQDALYTIGKTVAQQVKTEEQHNQIVATIYTAFTEISFEVDGVSVTAGENIHMHVDGFFKIWKTILPSFFAKLNSEAPELWLTKDLVDRIKHVCTDCIDFLEREAEHDFLNENVKRSLTKKQKFSYLAIIFLHQIDSYRQELIQKHCDDYFKVDKISKEHLGKTNVIKLYPELILAYEILTRLKRIYLEESKAARPKGIIEQSPSTFIHMRLNYGKKADDLRILYRWLFIKAYLFSFLKDKDMSANKAAEGMANYDQFFLVGEKSGQDDIDEKRRKTLANEFSNWNKHQKQNQKEGLISINLTKRCGRPFWK
jgi:hypothetical protein